VAEAQPGPSRAERLGYEPTDANVRAILWLALTLVVVVGVFAGALGGLVALFHTEAGKPPVSPLARVEIRPPPPRLDAHPEETLAAVHKRETAALEGFGWVDRDAGIARIPIEQAMRLLADRGWPSATKPAGEPSGSGAPAQPTGGQR
jgi:hypothetical protein